MSRYSSAIAATAVAILFLALCLTLFGQSLSADFRALWLAGEALAAGRPDLVYPADRDYFTMLPPDGLIAQLAAQGFKGEVFAYVYPPLWAWLASKLAAVTGYESLLSVVRPVNAVLILGMLACARRMAAPSLPLGLYWLAGVALLLLTTVGWVAFYQNQPQILVAFLTVLAVERAGSGAQRTAGVCLALAAAIKLYPALYAILWLAAGRRQAALSFAVAGGALGLLSIFVAGWPLHAQFLAMLSTISDTALVTKICYAWESTLAHLFWRGDLIFIPEPLPVEPAATRSGWYVLSKPLVLVLLFKALQAAAMLGAIVLFCRGRGKAGQELLWPFAFALFTMLGPIAWSYHYLAVLAFVPALLPRIGARWMTALALGLVVALSPFVPMLMAKLVPNALAVNLTLQTLGTITVSALAALFALQALRSGRNAPASDIAEAQARRF